MRSTVSAAMPSVPAIVGVAAMAFIAAATKPTFSPGSFGAFLWCRKNCPPKEKENDARERQEQDSEVHPAGRSHLGLARFQRLGSRFNSIARM
jgi:hypothetical protein